MDGSDQNRPVVTALAKPSALAAVRAADPGDYLRMILMMICPTMNQINAASA